MAIVGYKLSVVHERESKCWIPSRVRYCSAQCESAGEFSWYNQSDQYTRIILNNNVPRKRCELTSHCIVHVDLWPRVGVCRRAGERQQNEWKKSSAGRFHAQFLTRSTTRCCPGINHTTTERNEQGKEHRMACHCHRWRQICFCDLQLTPHSGAARSKESNAKEHRT